MTKLYEALWSGLLALLPGGEATQPVFPGYVEGEYIYVAPESPGRITAVAVAEGAAVAAGDLLFTLDARLETESLAAAVARAEAAGAALKNMQSGARPEELAVTQATLTQAEADLDLANRTLERSQSLRARNNISDAQVDADRARATSTLARVNQLRAQLAVAGMGGRPAEIAAARANVRAAEAEVRRMEIALSQKQVVAPANGRVERLFYEVGEITVAAPVVSILPDSGRIVRFFVAEEMRATLTPGAELPVTCDGCPAGLFAAFAWISTDPEFTPPIIFSREERSRLVFRAEARLPADSTLLPGQPVTLGPPK